MTAGSWKATLRAGMAACALLATPARAQATDPSANVTAKLIELLIQKGVLSGDQARALLSQAQQDAKPRPAARAAARPPAPAAPAPAEPEAPPGSVRVTYVPQIVRDQIAAQVRQQILEEAKTSGWAAPNVLPDWVQRVRVYGDLRVRGESVQQQKANYPFFPDFNAIDNSAGFDTAGSALPPLLNTTENRNRLRLRARVGVAAKLDDWISTDIRIATGNDTSPISTNQTLGQNGNFSKYAIWLDQAYVKLTPVEGVVGYLGRAPNPFWTTDLLFDDDLSFDGISAQGSLAFGKSLSGFLNAGAFAVFNTDFNFASTSVDKFPSHDKYLFAVQGGGDWQIAEDYALKLAAGYFAFNNVEGKLSSPCLVITASDACSTDLTRPQFQTFGNTLFPIRNLQVNPSNPNGAQPQYYGLASRFGILDLHGRFDVAAFKPVIISVDGDFVKNLSFNRASTVGHGPVNNLGTNNQYQGGDTGYAVRVTVGYPKMEKLWDWNVYAAYKYLESDAVLDAFTDSDFHLGGTNAKGYIFGGNLGLTRNAWLAARWITTNQISGPPWANDIVQIDFNAKF